MLLLLPPSESKTQAGVGAPVDLSSLSFPELTQAREAMLERLAEVSVREDAPSLLKTGASLIEEIRRNANLLELPAAPAVQVYSGVLYDALDPAAWDGAARRRADESLVVVSALWGALRPTDLIPAYRLPIGARIAPKGSLAAWWRSELGPVLEEAVGDGLVVDCRSSGYQAAWKAPSEQTVEIRAERERNDVRTVVSHMAKHYRGLVARALLESGAEPAGVEELAEVLREPGDGRTGLEVETAGPGTGPARLTVVVRD